MCKYIIKYVKEEMCASIKNCIKKLNGKMWALISMIFDIIFAICLYKWKDDSSKKAIFNLIDKIIHWIINLFVLFRDSFCCKKKDENVEKSNALEEGKKWLNTISERENIIKELKKLSDNKEPENANEAREAKELLQNIVQEEQKMINKININENKN